MSQRFAVAALALTLWSAACAQPSAEQPASRTSPGGVPLAPISAADSTQRAEEVSHLVASHLEALATGNTARVDSLTADDHVHISSAGQRVEASQLLEQHRAGWRPKHTVESVKTRVYNGDVAVVNVVVIGADGARTHVTQVWNLTDDQPLYVRSKSRGAIRLAVNTRLAMCCSMGRWEMTSSHASAAPNDPMSTSSTSASASPSSSQPADPTEPKMNTSASPLPGLIWP